MPRGSAIVLAEEARARAALWRDARPHGEPGRPRPACAWDVIYASTFLNLCEFLALAGDAVSDAATIVYFHENQLVYPVRRTAEWDYQFALVNITTALAADRCVFNSRYNRDSFLAEIPAFLRLFPDHRPAGIPGRIAASAEVLAPPFDAALIDSVPLTRGLRPRIVWPHRWEHDKDPDTFLRAAHALAGEGLDFEVAIAGQPHRDTRAAIEGAADRLGDRIVHLGQLESPEAYARLLRASDVAVSTAMNEFFGLAMIEASYAGCLPIVPDRLAYPEVYPAECRYGSFDALVSQLRSSVIGRPAPGLLRETASRFTFDALAAEYLRLFERVAAGQQHNG